MESPPPFWRRNIERNGRLLRFWIGFVFLLVGIALGIVWIWWVGLLVAFAGSFAMYEGVRGWCFLRACGIKTRL